jgi:hypothetical protein
MPDIIKNIFKYGELRRTIFLNAHNKDDYGRHRGQVLYGMNISGSGTVLSIAPGAIYTSQGQRLFFDVTDGVVDIGPGIGNADAFSLANQANLPLVVMVSLTYTFDQARIAKGIEVTTAVGQSALFQLRGRIVPYEKNTVSPTYNLKPKDPVYLDVDQPNTYTSIQNWNGVAVAAPSGMQKDANSIQFGEVPLGYVLIGVDPATGAFATNLSSPGVSIVSYANPFDMISALVGQDVLVPLQPKQVVAALTQPFGTAVRQGYSSSNINGLIVSPALARPAYGTPAPGAGGTRADSLFNTYRQPSFLKDGVSILEALRRMDVVLRQWLNFTGKQDLINITQDAGSTLPLQASLDAILAKFDGSTSSLTNLNVATWPNGATGSDPINHVLKEGVVTHVENTLLGKLGTAEGDSVRSALAALDIAIHVILTNVLGQSIPRSQLRDNTGGSFTPLGFDERPEGRALLARPAFSGTAVDVYQTTQSILAAVGEALARTLGGVGVNWLANSGFWAGDTDSGTQANPPAFWAFTGVGGTGTWARVEHAASGRVGKVVTVALDPNTNFDQVMASAIADNYIGGALASARHLSFSAVIQTNSVQGIQLHVIGYSDVAGTVPVFDVTSAVIPQSSNARIVSGTFAIGATDVINHVKFRVVSSTPSAACQFSIAGAAFNAGMPISVTEMASLPVDFVSRDGGAAKQMRAPLYLGGFQVKNGAAGSSATDFVILSQISGLAPIASPAFTGIPTAPTASLGTNTTQIATTAFVLASIPAAAQIIRPITSDFISTGIGTLVPGGNYFLDSFSVAAAQPLTAPVHVRVSGNFTLGAGGSITSGYPVVIECGGNVAINGTISCPLLIIRAAGTVSITAAILNHVASLANNLVPSVNLGLGLTQARRVNVGGTGPSNGEFTEAQKWRATHIDASGSVTISAGITSDEIFIKTLGSLTITGAQMARHWQIAGNPANRVGWHDGVYQNTYGGDGVGGGGGTGGGGGGYGYNGGYGSTNPASAWKGTPTPFLLPAMALAYGGDGGGTSGQGYPVGDTAPVGRGAGGGRVSLYAAINITLTGATFDLRGNVGDVRSGGSDGHAAGGGGGGGTFRAVCQGVMTGGTVQCDGGGPAHHGGGCGGGGGAYALASSYGTAPVMTVSVFSSDVASFAGTSLIQIATAAQIANLEKQRLFEVLSIDTPGLQQ